MSVTRIVNMVILKGRTKVKSPNDRNADKNATEDFKRQALEEGWLTEEELNEIERAVNKKQ